ncbi:MAG TPA: hypothetical protein VFC15_00480 [Candidatus Limnocylindrales bacterium]|jgi:hypothetical protein|nr:hypothetical protein [Candidatus Limnocylindrales bacterium]
MIIALAGRRVDAIDASQPRFPPQDIDKVSAAVRALLKQHGATAVVSSAACGADLIGLAEAGKLGLRRRIVLPFGRTKFRESSVVDRPGDWGKMYDTILDDVEANGDLVVIDTGNDKEPYAVTNAAILDQAIVLGRERGVAVAATLVWDGISRGKDDYTDQFGAEARKRGLPVMEVPTI